jgi:hypothetical protein
MRDEQNGCAPACPHDRVQKVRVLWTAGALLAGAGAAAVIGASIWWRVGASAGSPAAGAATGGARAFSLEVGARF